MFVDKPVEDIEEFYKDLHQKKIWNDGTLSTFRDLTRLILLILDKASVPAQAAAPAGAGKAPHCSRFHSRHVTGVVISSNVTV